MKRFNWLYIVFISLLVIACDNDDSGTDDHIEAEGFRISQNEMTIAEQLPDSNVTGTIELHTDSGEVEFEIQFYDHDGDLFIPGGEHNHEGGEGEEELDVEIDNESIVGFEFEHDHDAGKATPTVKLSKNEDAWHFHMEGLTAGSTTIRFLIMHGDHADFRSKNVTVNVATSVVINR